MKSDSVCFIIRLFAIFATPSNRTARHYDSVVMKSEYFLECSRDVRVGQLQVPYCLSAGEQNHDSVTNHRLVAESVGYDYGSIGLYARCTLYTYIIFVLR